MSKVQPSKCTKWEILYKNWTKQLLQEEKFLHKNFICRKIILIGVLAEPLTKENFASGKHCNCVTTSIQQPLNRMFMTKCPYKISASCLMPILIQNKMLKSKFLLPNTQCKFELNNEMQSTVQTGINGRLLSYSVLIPITQSAHWPGLHSWWSCHPLCYSASA